MTTTKISLNDTRNRKINAISLHVFLATLLRINKIAIPWYFLWSVVIRVESVITISYCGYILYFELSIEVELNITFGRHPLGRTPGVS